MLRTLRNHQKFPRANNECQLCTDTVTPWRGLYHGEHSRRKESNAEVTGGHRLGGRREGLALEPWGTETAGTRNEKGAGEKEAPPSTSDSEVLGTFASVYLQVQAAPRGITLDDCAMV